MHKRHSYVLKNKVTIERVKMQQKKFKAHVIFHIPHKIDAKMNTKLCEDGIHLTNISSIAMRVKQCKSGWFVLHVHSHNVISFLCDQFHHLHIFSLVSNLRHPQLSAWFIRVQGIWRWVWRKEGKFCCHRWCCIPHHKRKTKLWKPQTKGQFKCFGLFECGCGCLYIKVHVWCAWVRVTKILLWKIKEGKLSQRSHENLDPNTWLLFGFLVKCFEHDHVWFCR